MRFPLALASLALASFFGATALIAQNTPTPAPASQPKPVTVPVTLDQGRIVIDVDVPLPSGSIERVRGWVDSASPDLYMSQRLAGLLGLALHCDGQSCAGTPAAASLPLQIVIGGLKVILPATSEVRIPAGKPALAPGMSAEINIPSSILRNYAVLINFPDREFTLGPPGSLKFNGDKSKMLVNPSNGLIQIPSKIDNKNCDLGLGVGSSVNFLSELLFDKLANAHPAWPQLTGAVGPFNTGERNDEPAWKLMRVDRIQFGPLFLTDAAVARLPENPTLPFVAFASTPTVGILASEALMNYRIGLDYAHSIIYFDIGRTAKFPGFDVPGLILRAEDDNTFTILGVADFEGKPSVPDVQAGDHLVAVGDSSIANFTMGQVWALLEGSPRQERRLTIERAAKQFSIVARAQHFLGEPHISDPLGNGAKNDETRPKPTKN